MEKYSFDLTRTSPTVGAEITGVDLSQPISDRVIKDIRRALGDFGVLFFRDQQIDPATHLAFSQKFGDINVNKFFSPVAGFPEIASVTREPNQKGSTGWYWHTDHSYDQVPAMGSVFVAREIPPVGGDTLFAGMYAPFEALSIGLQTMLEGLQGWHSDLVCPEVADPTTRALFADRQPGLEQAGTRAMHPVVIRHPISGRRALYVNSGFTERFDGWTVAESQPLLRFLYDHATQPQFTYRHRWRAGDVAFWDNRATWHCALDDCFGYRREMHRITIEGDPLYAGAA